MADALGTCSGTRCTMHLHVSTMREETSSWLASLGATCERSVDWVGCHKHRVASKKCGPQKAELNTSG